MHYYKFNISAWNLSTAHLEPHEESVYFRLVNHYYDTEEPIPLETHAVIRRLRLANHLETVSDMLCEFFIETEKGWVHNKCEQVLFEYKKQAKKNKKNGKLGGRPRKQRAAKKPTGNPLGTQTEPKHNPNYELRTTNYKLETNNQLKTLDHPTVDHFELFWLAGMRKIGKKKSEPLFNRKLKASNLSADEFTAMLCKDVRARIDIDQLGFTEMHPTTYLNGELPG